jgi:hypothetical protein
MARTAHDQTARVPRTGLSLAPAGRPAATGSPTGQVAGWAVRLASPSQPQHCPGYARVSPAVRTSGPASRQLTQKTHFCREWYKTAQCPHCCRGAPVGEFRCAAASPRSGKLLVATATRRLRQDRRFREHGGSRRRVPPCSGYKAGNFRTSCFSSPVGGCEPDRSDQRSREADRAAARRAAARRGPRMNGRKAPSQSFGNT